MSKLSPIAIVALVSFGTFLVLGGVLVFALALTI